MSFVSEETSRRLGEAFKAPISRSSIGANIDIFERRMNGSILPFLGLHGGFLALLYLLQHNDLLIRLAIRFGTDWALGVLLVGVAGAILGLDTALRFAAKTRRVPGAVALAQCLVAVAAIATFGLFQPVFALAIFIATSWALLAANAVGWVSDHEADTSLVYLPLICFVVGDFGLFLHFVTAIALYAPAVIVRFLARPQAGKLALGLSAILFLGSLLEQSDGEEGLVGLLVLAVLVTFVVHTIRVRHTTGAGLRYFIADLIVVSLWGILVTLATKDSQTLQVVDVAEIWGSGIVAFTGVAMTVGWMRGRGRAGDARAFLTPATDAHLVWLMIAMFAVTSEWIASAYDASSHPYIAPMTVALPFVVAALWLRAPFLAFGARLAMGIVLLNAFLVEQDRLADAVLMAGEAGTPEALYRTFLDRWDAELAWVGFVFAVAYLATVSIRPAYDVAWWRGLIRPRHAAHLRRGWRLTMDNATRIALIGGVLATLGAVLKWFGLAGARHFSRDALLIAVHLFGAAITVLYLRFAVWCCEGPGLDRLQEPPFVFLERDIAFVAAACAWGLVLYLRGVLGGEFLARFFATAFVVAPLAGFLTNNAPEDGVFLAETAVICGLTLFCFGLVRHAAGAFTAGAVRSRTALPKTPAPS